MQPEPNMASHAKKVHFEHISGRARDAKVCGVDLGVAGFHC